MSGEYKDRPGHAWGYMDRPGWLWQWVRIVSPIASWFINLRAIIKLSHGSNILIRFLQGFLFIAINCQDVDAQPCTRPPIKFPYTYETLFEIKTMPRSTKKLRGHDKWRFGRCLLISPLMIVLPEGMALIGEPLDCNPNIVPRKWWDMLRLATLWHIWIANNVVTIQNKVVS